MKRKSPSLHIVHGHKRQGNIVNRYWRGHGSNKLRLANPTIAKKKVKHFLIRYELHWSNGRVERDSTNSFVKSKKDIIPDFVEKHLSHIPKEKRPRVKLLKVSLQIPKKRLKALLDVDARTRNRLARGYILGHVKISLINLPPVRVRARYQDNYKKMKGTQAVPPVHLTLLPNGRFDVEDGVHRIHSAKDMGYDEIPALFKYGD